jgi:hypothetical protein
MSDFSHYLRPRPRRVLVIGGAAIALLTAAAILLAWNVQVRNHISSAQSLKEQVAASRRVASIAKPNREEEEAARRWSALRTERQFSWYPIFRALERASDENVELLEFQPDKAGRRLLLRGEAKDLESLTSYLDRLASQSAIKEAYLAHQKIRVRGAQPVIAFEIRATLDQ